MRKLEEMFVSFVLLSVLAIRAGSARDCYSCDSETTPECTDIKKSTLKPVNCKPSVIDQGGEKVGDWLKEITKIDFFETADVTVPMVCQKIIAKNEKNKIVTFRGCQLEGGKTDICDRVKAKAGKADVPVEIVDCAVCDDDACNKSTSLQLINLWLLLVPLALVKLLV